MSENKTCYLCLGSKHKKREGKIRNLDDVDVLECENCSLVFLSSFSHMNEEFYQNGDMHSGLNIDNWVASTKIDDLRRFDFVKKKIKNKKVLDFGSGNASFLKLAKNVAKEAVGLEIDETFSDYFKEHNLKVIKNIHETDEKFDVITMFHVLEHLQNPKEILKELSEKLEKNGEIIIEIPSSNDALLKVYNNKGFKNFTYWGCHLFLFNEKTLKKLFKDSDFKINYIKHIQRYGIANHLHWLLKNKPNGHNIWKMIDLNFLNKIYETILSFFKITDTIIISVSLK